MINLKGLKAMKPLGKSPLIMKIIMKIMGGLL